MQPSMGTVSVTKLLKLLNPTVQCCYYVQTMHSRSLVGKCRMSLLVMVGNVASCLFFFLLQRSTCPLKIH